MRVMGDVTTENALDSLVQIHCSLLRAFPTLPAKTVGVQGDKGARSHAIARGKTFRGTLATGLVYFLTCDLDIFLHVFKTG